MSFPLSDRIAKLQPSDIHLMTHECEWLDGINLGQGLGDLPTPPLVANAAIKAIQEGRNTRAIAYKRLFQISSGLPDMGVELCKIKLASDEEDYC